MTTEIQQNRAGAQILEEKKEKQKKKSLNREIMDLFRQLTVEEQKEAIQKARELRRRRKKR